MKELSILWCMFNLAISHKMLQQRRIDDSCCVKFYHFSLKRGKKRSHKFYPRLVKRYLTSLSPEYHSLLMSLLSMGLTSWYPPFQDAQPNTFSRWRGRVISFTMKPKCAPSLWNHLVKHEAILRWLDTIPGIDVRRIWKNKVVEDALRGEYRI